MRNIRLPYILYCLIIAAPAPMIAWAGKVYRDTRPEQVVLAPKPKVGVLDLLTAEKRVSIWFDYAREVPSLVERLSSPDEFTTLLVPVNSAVMSLPYKPHQLPSSSLASSGKADTLEAQELQSESNIQRWVESYVVPDDVTLSSSSHQQTHQTLLDGHSVILTLPSTREEALKGWRVASAASGAAGGGNVVAIQEGSNGKLMLVDGCIDIA